MTAPLALEPQGDGWRLALNGDWSLAAMPGIEAQLRSLPLTLHGNLICDWTQARTPGISPAWALLRRLAEAVPPLTVSHAGNPPHFLQLLQNQQHVLAQTRKSSLEVITQVANQMNAKIP